MFNHPFALELAYVGVEEATRLGASYVDARFEYNQHEEILTKNGQLSVLDLQTERGIGVRVLVRGAWGFAAVSEPTRHDVMVAARRAVDLARAAAVFQERPVRLVEQAPHRSLFRTSIKRDPLAVPIEDKLNFLFSIDERLRKPSGVTLTSARFSAHRTRKLFVSSEGSEIDQELVWTAAGYYAGAHDGYDFQVRSFPCGASGIVGGKGWELLSEFPFLDRAEDVAREAVDLLRADPCPSIEGDLLLSHAMMAEQVHHSCGHVAELDRVLGLAPTDNGRSFLDADKLGSLQFASPIVNLVADAREVGGAGSFGFDDEGVEAQRVELITGGRLTGYLSGRETASIVGLDRSPGTMRASNWASVPMVRASNVALMPGESGDLEALVADTKNGILLDGPRGFVRDDRGEGFLVQAEIAWEIRNGKRVRPLKNPSYRASTLEFWSRCNAVCGPRERMLLGAVDEEKGRPFQRVPVGRAVVPARFASISVGASFSSTGSEAAQSPKIESSGVESSELLKSKNGGGTKPSKKKVSKRSKKKGSS